MNKWIKWFFIALLCLVLLLAAAIAIFVATFNPNSYKSRLETYVLDNYARVLTIDGDISMSVFPDLALQISDVSLSESGSKDEFAAIKDARLSVAVWPLLSRQVKIDHISVTGLEAKIAKNKDGIFNFADLLGQNDAAAQKDSAAKADANSQKPATTKDKSDLTIDVAGVDLKDSQLEFTDKKSGLHLNIYKINAKTGAISLGKPFDTEFEALINSNQPQLAIQLKLSSEITLDNNYQDILFSSFDLNATGDLADLKQLKSDLHADINLKNGDLLANNIQLSLTGDLAGEKPLPGINLQLAGSQLNLYPKESVLTGDLAIDRASYSDKIRDVQITDIGARIKSDKNGLLINNIAANLYEGSLSGEFSKSKNQQLGLKLDLEKIALQALLKSMSDKDLLAGRGFVKLAVNAAGNDLKDIEKTLTGTLALQVQEGALLGLDARQTLADVSDLIDGLSNIKQLRLDKIKSPFDKNAQTSFSKFDLLLNIKNGQGHINKLLVKSDLFDVTQGSPAEINIPAQNLDVLLNTKIAEDMPKSDRFENVLGITIPVRVHGAWSDPQYSVKLESLLRDQAVKNVIESGLDKLLGNKSKKTDAKDSGKEKSIGKALKGLFGN